MNRVIITILVIIGIAVLLFYVTKNKTATAPTNKTAINQSAGNGNLPESKTNEENSIKIKVTPTDILSNSPVWKFNIVLDTHSAELDYDLIKVVSLFDDQNKEYKPSGWDGPGAGGHHIDGTLAFKAVSPLPQKIEIRVLNVGGVASRNFTWQLK